MTPPPSPRRRKLRMLRDEPAGDTIVVIRATPLTVDATIEDIAEAATESAEAYEVTAESVLRW